jgi:hypothetical protein
MDCVSPKLVHLTMHPPEKHSKNLENIKVKRDSLHPTLKETNANY